MAGVVKSVNTGDLKSPGLRPLRVQFPPSALAVWQRLTVNSGDPSRGLRGCNLCRDCAVTSPKKRTGLPLRLVDRHNVQTPARASVQPRQLFDTLLERLRVGDRVAPVTGGDSGRNGGGAPRTPAPGAYYFAFVDPSGGSHDSFTLAIAHFAGAFAVLDAVREVR